MLNQISYALMRLTVGLLFACHPTRESFDKRPLSRPPLPVEFDIPTADCYPWATLRGSTSGHRMPGL